MDDAPEPIGSTPESQAPIDLSVLQRIEEELDAVERALEQIDRGVFDGFAGLEPPPSMPGDAD